MKHYNSHLNLPARIPKEYTMKTHVYTKKLSLLLALILNVVPVLNAQQQTAQSIDSNALLTQPMPVDPQITTGQFKNGLRYYIRTTGKPEKRAELRLVVKAGSVLEDEPEFSSFFRFPGGPYV